MRATFSPFTIKLKSVLMAACLAQTLMGVASADQSDASGTIVVQGKVSEKSAFEMQFTYISNSGAKINDYPYQSYQIPFAKIKNVAPEDREPLKAAISNWLKARKIGEKPMVFYISHSEVSGKYVYMVGEHQSNQAYAIRKEVEQCLAETTLPSGRHYNVYLNKKGIYVPGILVGELGGACPKAITYLINDMRITQDSLIYNNPMFTVTVDSIAVE